MDIKKNFAKSQLVLEEYWRLSLDSSIPIDIGFLILAVQNYTELDIKLVRASWSAHQIKGRLTRYNNRAEIVISEKLNDCWSRYVIAKELGHLIIDTEDSSVGSVEQGVDLIAGLLSPSAGFSDQSAQNGSEFMAMLVAADVLFPVDHRVRYIHKVAPQDQSAHDVALAYKIPQKIVEFVLDVEFHNRYLKN